MCAQKAAGPAKAAATRAAKLRDLLDRYKIENLVARSGMASIYRATDMQTGQQVAIKIPHPEMEADPVLYDRFNAGTAGYVETSDAISATYIAAYVAAFAGSGYVAGFYENPINGSFAGA